MGIINLGFEMPCNNYINGNYQKLTLINKEDLLNYTIVSNETTNTITYTLKDGKNAFDFVYNENQSNINATYSKSIINGLPRYSHNVNLMVFGNDQLAKRLLKQFDNSKDFFIVAYNKDNTIEVYGFHNGFKVESYDYDDNTIIELTSSFNEYNLPYNKI